MGDNLLIDARRRAEEAVSDMPEGPLKIKAFEVILIRLLDTEVTGEMTDEGAAGSSVSSRTSKVTLRSVAERGISERALVAAKRPSNQAETVAVLAFFLRESGKAEFNAGDMRTAYIRAGIPLPKVLVQAIRDAKNKFDFVKAGREPGAYALTDHGDRSVRFYLPHGG